MTSIKIPEGFDSNDCVEVIMTHKDSGHYSAKHGSENRLDGSIAAAVEKRAVQGEIGCAKAFTVVSELQVSPSQVGLTLDLMEIRISRCQLGLFGYGADKRIVRAANAVSDELEKAIRDALVSGHLPCVAAWAIAERFGIPKMDVSSACEALKIRMKPCQLGAF
jgi:hypothetical protein